MKSISTPGAVYTQKQQSNNTQVDYDNIHIERHGRFIVVDAFLVPSCITLIVFVVIVT